MCKHLTVQNTFCGHSHDWLYYCEEVLRDDSRTIVSDHKIERSNPLYATVTSHECTEDCCRQREEKDNKDYQKIVNDCSKAIESRLTKQLSDWQELVTLRASRPLPAEIEAWVARVKIAQKEYDQHDKLRPQQDRDDRGRMAPAMSTLDTIVAKHRVHIHAIKKDAANDFGKSSGNATRIPLSQVRFSAPHTDRASQSSGRDTLQSSGRLKYSMDPRASGSQSGGSTRISTGSSNRWRSSGHGGH